MKPFRFPLTAATLLLALAVLAAGLIWRIDLIETPLHLLENLERSELDEILTLLLLIGVAFAVDRVHRNPPHPRPHRSRARRHDPENDDHGPATVNDFVAQLNLLRADLRTDAKRFGQLEAHMFHQWVEELSSKLVSSKLNAIDGLKC